MGHLYHGELLVITRGYDFFWYPAVRVDYHQQTRHVLCFLMLWLMVHNPKNDIQLSFRMIWKFSYDEF